MYNLNIFGEMYVSFKKNHWTDFKNVSRDIDNKIKNQKIIWNNNTCQNYVKHNLFRPYKLNTWPLKFHIKNISEK